MKFDVNHVSRKLIEVKVDEVSTGVLNAEEAKALALEFIYIAQELLEVSND